MYKKYNEFYVIPAMLRIVLLKKNKTKNKINLGL